MTDDKPSRNGEGRPPKRTSRPSSPPGGGSSRRSSTPGKPSGGKSRDGKPGAAGQRPGSSRPSGQRSGSGRPSGPGRSRDEDSRADARSSARRDDRGRGGSDKPYGSRKPSGGDDRGRGGSDKPYGSRKPSGGDDRGRGGSDKPYGSRKPSGSDERGRGGSDKPYGSRKPSGSGRDDGGRGKPYGSRKPSGSGRDDGGRGKRYDTSGKPSGSRDSRSGDRRVREERELPENALPWPEEIFDMDLDPELRAELESVGGTSGALAKHLLSVEVLAEDDPEAAYQHALRIRERIPRLALGRQTLCIAAYRTGRYREAIKEEAAYRRTSNKFDLVAIAADSERGLGRPQRALAMVTEFESAGLDADTLTELLIVAGGARQDLGDVDAARIFLQKAVRAAKSPMAMARSRFALGQLLIESDPQQARKWLQAASDIDEESVWTDAAALLESM